MFTLVMVLPGKPVVTLAKFIPPFVDLKIKEPDVAYIKLGLFLLIAISLIVPLVPPEIGDQLAPQLVLWKTCCLAV